MTSSRVEEEKLEVEELSKKEKGLRDMDNSVVIVGGGIRGLNGNGKKKIKQKISKKEKRQPEMNLYGNVKSDR